MKYFSWFIIAVVAMSVIAAFFIAGSPADQRLKRFDDQRIGDLQQIQYQIGDYFQNKQKLPAALSDMNDSFRNVIVPQDPESHSDYGYRIRGLNSFSLCATFHLPSAAGIDQKYPQSISGPGYYGPSANWDHTAGEQCFERTIDTAYFKPLAK